MKGPPLSATMPSSLEIAQQATLRPITEIAEAAGLLPDEIDPYGKYKAKVSLDVLDRLADRPDGKLINVTAITPTKAGEGKTTTSVSLTQGLGHLGKHVALCLREASLGPVFGIKGGAAGGGYTQVVPMEDMNLHFTGDIHAIGAANNLLAAMVEAHLLHGNALDIEPLSVSWRRCMDINDRALRDMVVGLGGKANGYPRQTGFDITAASEVMAIVAVARRPLRPARGGSARSRSARRCDGEPVTAEQIGAAGVDDGAPEGDDQAEPRADARGPAGVRPLRPVREHRARQQLARRRPRRAEARRTTSSPRAASARTWGWRSSSTSSAGSADSGRTRSSSSRRSRRSSTTRGDPDGGARGDRDAAPRTCPPPRDRPRVRAQPGRRGQPLPRRHRRGGRARARARARARRLRLPRSTTASRRAAPARPRSPRSVVAAADEPTELRLHLPARRDDRGQDRGDREARLRRRRDLPSAGRT